MPYIRYLWHRKLLKGIVKQSGHIFKEKGNLNYFMFKLAKDTCHDYGDYEKFFGSTVMGLFEIYRRQVAPYEDKKIKENGDVE